MRIKATQLRRIPPWRTEKISSSSIYLETSLDFDLFHLDHSSIIDQFTWTSRKSRSCSSLHDLHLKNIFWTWNNWHRNDGRRSISKNFQNWHKGTWQIQKKILLCLKMIFYAIKTVKNLASPQHNLRLTYLYDSIFALSVSGITKIAENH